MNSIEIVWTQLEATRAKSDIYKSGFPMNPSAGADLLEQVLTKTLGFRVPDQLEQSLLIHNGMDSKNGVWRNSLIPLSVEAIVETWRADRQREEESRNEGQKLIKLHYQIPIMADPTAHHEIYMNANNGAILNYVVDGIYFSSFQFSSYLEFLTSLRDHESLEGHFEWPRS